MAFYSRTVDTLLQLWDGTAVTNATGDGYAQVSSNPGQVDLGGDTIKGTATTARMACAVHLVVSAASVADDDEGYVISIVGSNASDFASGNAVLGAMEIASAGATAKILPDTGLTSTTGRYVIPFINERAGTVYRYIRLYVDVTGTTSNIQAQAWLSKVSEFPM